MRLRLHRMFSLLYACCWMNNSQLPKDGLCCESSTQNVMLQSWGRRWRSSEWSSTLQYCFSCLITCKSYTRASLPKTWQGFFLIPYSCLQCSAVQCTNCQMLSKKWKFYLNLNIIVIFVQTYSWHLVLLLCNPSLVFVFHHSCRYCPNIVMNI